VAKAVYLHHASGDQDGVLVMMAEVTALIAASLSHMTYVWLGRGSCPRCQHLPLLTTTCKSCSYVDTFVPLLTLPSRLWRSPSTKLGSFLRTSPYPIRRSPVTIDRLFRGSRHSVHRRRSTTSTTNAGTASCTLYYDVRHSQVYNRVWTRRS